MGKRALAFLLFFVLLLQLAAAGNMMAESPSSAEVTEAAVVVLTELSVSPTQVNLGGSVDFSLSVRNVGNLQTTAQANITIKNSTNDEVGRIVFASMILSPGEEVVLSSSWSTGNLPAGAYAALAEGAYDGIPTNTLTRQFSIVVPGAPPAPVAPGGGAQASPTAAPAPGLVLPKPLPPKITPEKGVVVFTKKTVLKEVLAGDSAIESFRIRNDGRNTETLSITVSGAPSGFVSPQQDEVVIPSGKNAVVNLGVSVPKDALLGDYLVKITAEDGKARAVEYMVLRVKNFAANRKVPITLKTVSLDERDKTTSVTLTVRNPLPKAVEILRLFEQIPAELATLPSQVTFSERVGAVASPEPLTFGWELRDIAPGDTVTVAYIIHNMLNEYSPYLDWPVNQAVFSTERAESLLRIQELMVPAMSAGEPSTVTALLFYGGLEPLFATIVLEPPQGFSVTPENRQLVLVPRSLTRVSFEVTPGQGVDGSHASSLVVSSENFTIRQAALFIVKPVLGTDWRFLAAAVAAVVPMTFLIGRALVRRKRLGLERQFRKEAVDERDGYLKQVRDGVLGKE